MHIENFSVEFPDVKVCSGVFFEDKRGFLKKTMFGENLNELINPIREVIISNSERNVIRGMHYQKRPDELIKLISCSSGSILDVFININKKSKNYGKYGSIELSEKDSISLLIPPNYAHGYLVRSKTASVVYLQSGDYNPETEDGINPLGFGFNWGVKTPIISKKDLGLNNLNI